MKKSVIALSAAAVVAVFAGVASAAPPFTVTSLANSGQLIEDVGIINSGLYNNTQVPACTGGRGIIKVAVNSSGQWLIQTDAPSLDTFFDGALLSSLLEPGPFGRTPYLIEGFDGFLSAPTLSYIAAPFGQTEPNACSPANPFWLDNWMGAMAVNDGGVNAMMLRVLPSLAADPELDASSAVYSNLDAVVAMQGQPVNAAGLAAGTVWGELTSDTAAMSVNAGGQFFLVAPIVESGVTKLAAIVVSTDGQGNVISTTLLAKEGGLVGAGPATWTALSAAAHACAINDAGQAIFTGTTSTGVSGIYTNGQFAAVSDGPTPVAGKNWGALLGAPLDLNNNGSFVFRAPTAAGSGVWNELSPDAGEETDGQNGVANVPADSTVGNGALNRLVGSLSSDTDVDMYRIRIDDPANFSATMVPDPGNGFPGATFDTMMYLIREPANGTSIVQRSDDAAPGVLQSTLSNMVPAVGDYYVAVTTPKVRPQVSRFYFGAQQRRNEPAWIEDPGFIAVGNGRVLWSDPSEGKIKRVLSATGAAELPDAAIADPQGLTIVGSNITGPISVVASAGKVYWVSEESGATRIRRSNFDGSAIENVVSSTLELPLFGTTSVAADGATSRLFWSRALLGEIWRSDINGNNPQMMLKIPDEIIGGFPVDFSCRNLAVAGGFVFWTNPISGRIQRCSQTVPQFSGPSVVTTLVSNVQAEQIAVDAAAGKLYWTETAGNVIKRCNFDGTSQETFQVTDRPVGIAVDGTTVFWSNGDDRVIRKSPIAGPAPSLLVSLGQDIGVTRPDSITGNTSFDRWERVAASTPGALPYQVRLTGAVPRTPDVIIAKDNIEKVAATYDPVPGVANSRMVVLGSATDAVKLSDRGDVMWRGNYFEPTAFNNFLASALFLNNEVILKNGDIPPGFSDRLVFLHGGPYSIDMSPNGEWAIVAANTQVPPFNFTFQPDRALLLHFEFPPTCLADFNQDGFRNPDDLADFITCFFLDVQFPGFCPAADFNGDTSRDPDDLADFITTFFLAVGC